MSYSHQKALFYSSNLVINAKLYYFSKWIFYSPNLMGNFNSAQPFAALLAKGDNHDWHNASQFVSDLDLFCGYRGRWNLILATPAN